jgi:hypothetical protein
MFKEIKWFIQRGRRGYSDRDIWSFHDYLCDIMPPILRKLSKNSCGCPSDLWDKEIRNNECHKWLEILETMAQGFESAQSISNMSYYNTIKTENGYTREIDSEKVKLLTEKYENGMDLFRKYFLSLWD